MLHLKCSSANEPTPPAYASGWGQIFEANSYRVFYSKLASELNDGSRYQTFTCINLYSMVLVASQIASQTRSTLMPVLQLPEKDNLIVPKGFSIDVVLGERPHPLTANQAIPAGCLPGYLQVQIVATGCYKEWTIPVRIDFIFLQKPSRHKMLGRQKVGKLDICYLAQSWTVEMINVILPRDKPGQMIFRIIVYCHEMKQNIRFDIDY